MALWKKLCCSEVNGCCGVGVGEVQGVDAPAIGDQTNEVNEYSTQAVRKLLIQGTRNAVTQNMAVSLPASTGITAPAFS